jgi:hypothetical protein
MVATPVLNNVTHLMAIVKRFISVPIFELCLFDNELQKNRRNTESPAQSLNILHASLVDKRVQ